MEFVAQKLGFLKYQHNQGTKMVETQSKVKVEGGVEESNAFDGRKSSQDDSSSTSSIGISKLRITDTSDSDPETKPGIGMGLGQNGRYETQSLGLFPQPLDFNSLIARFHMTAFDQLPGFSFENDFCNNQYLSSLIIPYGTPTKFIGPLTEFERKQKVNKYLEKKKNRQWKNVKYNVRKQLADSRKRVQGRFVKSERKWRWNQVEHPCEAVLQSQEPQIKVDEVEVKMQEE